MRALVVDDDSSMVETIGDIMALRGWEVTQANSGEAAVSITATEPFDCVIMDVKMGGLDGLNALQQIRIHSPQLPVVLMTAYTAHELIAEAEREGALRRIERFQDVAATGQQILTWVNSGQHVAFITSSPGARDAMQAFLSERGCQVCVADSAETVTAAFDGHPSAILWEHHLAIVPPEGAVVISEVKAGALLALWGADDGQIDGDSPPVTERLRCGYLRKPFNMDHLFATIDALTV